MYRIYRQIVYICAKRMCCSGIDKRHCTCNFRAYRTETMIVMSRHTNTNAMAPPCFSDPPIHSTPYLYTSTITSTMFSKSKA